MTDTLARPAGTEYETLDPMDGVAVFAQDLTAARAHRDRLSIVDTRKVPTLSPRTVREGAGRGLTIRHLHVYGTVAEITSWMSDVTLHEVLAPTFLLVEALKGDDTGVVDFRSTTH